MGKRLLSFVVAAGCFLIGSFAEARTWTSISGAEIEADFVEETWGQVTLRKEDGTEIRIRLAQLSPEDQTYIRSGKAGEEAASEGKDGEKNAGKVLLPPMPPPNQAYHAIVTKPTYTAKLKRNGHLIIEPTARKPSEAPPHSVPVKTLTLKREGIRYTIPRSQTKSGRPKTVPRAIQEIQSSIQPGANPREILMGGSAVDGVEFEHEISFENDEICWSMKLDDPPSIEYPSRWSWGIRTPRTHKFGKEVELPEQKEATEGFYIEVKGRKDFEHPFWKSMRRSVSGVDRLILHGMFPDVLVEIDAQGDRSRFRVRPLYTGQPLFPGIRVRRILAERSGKITTCITFEPAP